MVALSIQRGPVPSLRTLSESLHIPFPMPGPIFFPWTLHSEGPICLSPYCSLSSSQFLPHGEVWVGQVGTGWCEDGAVDQLYSWPPPNLAPVHCCSVACSSLVLYSLCLYRMVF